MYCRYCNAENPELAETCVSCGKQLSAHRQRLHFTPKKPSRLRRHNAVERHKQVFPDPDERSAMSLNQSATPDDKRLSSAQAQPLDDSASGTHVRYRFPATPLSPMPDSQARGAASTDEAIPPPRPSPTSPPPFVAAKIDEDELDRRLVSQHRKHRSAGERIVRAGLFSVCILLLLTAGLFTMLWVEEQGGIEATAAMVVANVVGQPERNTTLTQPSRDELPYDGLSPEDADRMAARAAIPIDRSLLLEDEPGVTPATTVGNNVPNMRQRNSTGTSTEAETGGASKGVVTSVNTPAVDDMVLPADSNTKATSSGSSSKPAAATGTSAPDASDADAERKSAPAPSEKEGTGKSASKSDMQPQKVARGKEISRIQRQASEELKKKTRNRAGASITADNSSLNPRNRNAVYRKTFAQLARCERLDSLFSREHCKWKLCNGRWGTDGCPSYVQNARLLTN